MSSVVVQTGQCGNQIGNEFWKLILQQPKDNLPYRTYDGKFRSINADCEPKVVRALSTDTKTSEFYRRTNFVAGKKGCGSNWALGYYGNKSFAEGDLLPKVLEAARKEVERCSSFTGFICVHSLAGGTGSGLGSLLQEHLRDEFPANYILSCAVAPYSFGEIPVQDYNVLLSLNSLQKHSDAILLFDNDELLRQLQHKQGSGKDAEGHAARVAKSVSFSQINEHIALSMGGLFLPADSVSSKTSQGIGMEPWELIRSICPMPSLKFMHPNCLRRKSSSHLDPMATVSKMYNREQVNTYIATVLVARGNEAESFSLKLKQLESRIKFVSWNPFPVDFWTAKDSILGTNDAILFTAASNSDSVVPFLEQTVRRARMKFDVRAYLHWYERYGCTQEDFVQAFDNARTLIDTYAQTVA